MSPRTFNARIERDGDWYIGRCDEIPEAAGGGATFEECLGELRAYIQGLAVGACSPEPADSAAEIVLVTERERMIDEIHAAFADVSRGEGISWAEADVIDGYGLPSERAAARTADPERPWPELIDEGSWSAHDCSSEWSFLDALGFRYYLPPAMIRCLRCGYDKGIGYHLTLREGQLRDFTLSKWSALDERQKRCVAHFIDCMILISDSDLDRKGWQESGTYWQRLA